MSAYTKNLNRDVDYSILTVKFTDSQNKVRYGYGCLTDNIGIIKFLKK